MIRPLSWLNLTYLRFSPMVLITIFLVSAVTIIGCGGGGVSGSGTSGFVNGTSTGSTSATSTSASSSGITSSATTGTGANSGSTTSSAGGTSGSNGAKQTLVGLVSMGSEAFLSNGSMPTNNMEEINAHPGVYSGAVVCLQWSQLEPQEGVFDDSALQSALSNIQSYNSKYPSTPVVAKLRIFAGLGTPAWVIQATGGVTITNSSGNSATVGKFWTSQYRTFWQGLQSHLAAEFDSNPLIGEVAVTSGCTLTAEPFIIPLIPSAISSLHQAGYTDALMETTLSGAAEDYSAWNKTPLDYTFNTFNQTDSGFGVSNPSFTIQVMDAFRTALGTRAVIANHGLQDPLTSAAAPIYSEFQSLYTQAASATPPMKSPLEFQSYGPAVDWPSTVAFGLTYHPTEIEIWDTVAAGGPANISQSQLASWAASLKQ